MRLRFVLLLLLAVSGVCAADRVPAEMSGSGLLCPILIYHTVREYLPSESTAERQYITTPEAFEKELAFLKAEGYASVSMDDLAAALEGERPLPSRPVVLTFDDGWASQYRNAFPLLKKYGFRATFYIFTNGVGAKHFMNRNQLSELLAAGMEIGSHSCSHPYLWKIGNERSLREEIVESKKKLEALLGRPVTTFAYPFGHYTDAIVALTKEAGYRSARSTYPGIRHARDELFMLTGFINVTRVAEIEAGLLASLQPAGVRSEMPPPASTRRSMAVESYILD